METMKLNRYQIAILCPHLEHSRHNAVLDCQGANYPGIWGCRYGFSDEHEHTDYEVEVLATPSSNPDSSFVYTQEVYVCGVCGVVIKDESPAQDREEAEADRQIMEGLER